MTDESVRQPRHAGWARAYGRPVKAFSGRGELCFPDSSGHVSFSLVQFGDGTIRARAVSRTLIRPSHQWSGTLTGTTRDNGQIVVSEVFPTRWEIAQNRVTTYFIAGGAEVTASAPPSQPSVQRYALTNLIFTGDRQGDRPGCIDLRPVLQAWITPAPNMSNVVDEIRAGKGVDVTCVVESHEHCGLSEEEVDDLCLLLSFSRGTTVSWIYSENVQGGQVLHTKLRAAKTSSLTGPPVIAPDWDTGEFVRKTAPGFRELKERFRLRAIVLSYLDAKKEDVYLETRALRAATTLDLLAGLFARLYKREHIVGSAKSKKVEAAVKASLKNMKNLLPEELSELSQKLGEMRKRSFRRLVTELIEEFRVPPPSPERDDIIERVVDTRNRLVHRAEFRTPPPGSAYPDYAEIMGLLDRIILRMLGYEGRFIDITQLLQPADLVAT